MTSDFVKNLLSHQKYRDKALYDVVPMYMGHLLLGRPWQYDRRVQHDGFQNRYSFLMEGIVITLAPLSTREAHEDQLRLRKRIGRVVKMGIQKNELKGLLIVSVMLLSN